MAMKIDRQQVMRMLVRRRFDSRPSDGRTSGIRPLED